VTVATFPTKKTLRGRFRCPERPAQRNGFVKLGSASNLVARNPQQIIAQVDIKRVLLFGDDLAGYPLAILENQGLENGRRCGRGHEPGQTSNRHNSPQNHRPSIRYMKIRATLSDPLFSG
jgi:hypothetical protein